MVNVSLTSNWWVVIGDAFGGGDALLIWWLRLDGTIRVHRTRLAAAR